MSWSIDAIADTWTLAGLFQSALDAPLAALLVVVGFGAMVMSVAVMVKARALAPARPRPVRQKDVERRPAIAPAPLRATMPTAPVVPRPRTTTDRLRVRFPAILTGHPDVWDTLQPFLVAVEADPGEVPAGTNITLALHRAGRDARTWEARTDAQGVARFELMLDGKGEADLIARFRTEHVEGQAVRPVRVVDYREEIVETFEDFKSWADDQFPFVDLKMTAREFVDRFADGRPGTPTAPLDTIVDIYEVANYSEHPVDRNTYTRMVEAFLELESAGALDGEETA